MSLSLISGKSSGFPIDSFQAADQEADENVFTGRAGFFSRYAAGVASVLASAAIAKEKSLALAWDCNVATFDGYHRKQLSEASRRRDRRILLPREIYWNDQGVWVRSRKKLRRAKGKPDFRNGISTSQLVLLLRMSSAAITSSSSMMLNMDVINWIKNAHPTDQGQHSMGGQQSSHRQRSRRNLRSSLR